MAKEQNKTIGQLAIHVKAMGWEDQDCEYYARNFFDIFKSDNGTLPSFKTS